MTFPILTVSSGKLCRSLLGELLPRRGVASLPDVTVSSANTVALVGLGMTDDGQYVARRLRSAAAGLCPRVARRAFTLTEFASIARQVEETDFDDVCVLPLDDVAGRMGAIVDVAGSLRGVVEHLDDADLDVVDPYRQEREVFELSAAQVKPAVHATVGC